jgi:DNA polymerase III subunit epsilon
VELDSFISIDTETTGLDFEKDEIIQFGCSMFIRGQCVHRESFYIKSDIPISPEARATNGISQEDIDNGLERPAAIRLISLLLEKKTFSHRVVIYNAPFDLSMLANEFRRQDIPYDFSVMQILDPLVMWRNFRPFTKGTLIYVASALEIPYENAHDAGADSEVAGHVYLALRNRYGTIRKPYINSILAAWHRKWSIQLIDWYRSQDREINVEPWPIRKEWMCYRREPMTDFLA